MGPRTFGRAERRLLKEKLKQAELYAAEFYCIRPREWDKSPYDILTTEDDSCPPMPRGILAEVRQTHSISPGKMSSLKDFYTIRLSDENIVRTLEAGDPHFDLGQELWIVQHLEMGVNDVGVFLPQSSLQPFLITQILLPGSIQCLLQAQQLLLYLFLSNANSIKSRHLGLDPVGCTKRDSG